jgi:hypothetical protein
MMVGNLMKEFVAEGQKWLQLGLPMSRIADRLESHRQNIADIEIEF